LRETKEDLGGKKKNNTKNLEVKNFKIHNSQIKTIIAEASA
jgi:hypothetical protein